MIWMGAVSRSDMREQDKIPVHLYIDECHTVMKRDAMFRAIIQECRSQRIAITCAHQYLDDLTDIVKPALFNCAIRIANADDDASQLAPRLNSTPEAIKLPPHNFAAYVRDKMPTAVTIHVPFFDLSDVQMTYAPAARRPLPPQTEPAHVPRPVAVPASLDDPEDFG
jgi:hypothetical protein